MVNIAISLHTLYKVNPFLFPCKAPLYLNHFFSSREVIRPDVMEEVIVSCVIKHLSLVDALQSLVNYQYREDHAEEYDLVCKIMVETFKKINAMQRQLQVSFCYKKRIQCALNHVCLLLVKNTLLTLFTAFVSFIRLFKKVLL